MEPELFHSYLVLACVLRALDTIMSPI